MDLSDLRPKTESIAKAFGAVSISAREAADRMSALAVALRGGPDEDPRPKIGDYVRINEPLDADYGVLAQVDNVSWHTVAHLRDVYLILNPFGGGVKTRRTIDPRNLDILCAMEVLAEASR